MIPDPFLILDKDPPGNDVISGTSKTLSCQVLLRSIQQNPGPNLKDDESNLLDPVGRYKSCTTLDQEHFP